MSWNIFETNWGLLSQCSATIARVVPFESLAQGSGFREPGAYTLNESVCWHGARAEWR